jgi:hypothetical protein
MDDICINCGAPATGAVSGQGFCCPACVFDPEDCRCRFGESKLVDLESEIVEAINEDFWELLL